ncbi:hypothetical protein SNE40_003581 [Patella caerulea]|uniref:Uncharacterized protein n=1 Tax=Patella caerulea TaxID=87958 RepID=A0AAN8KED1_PATCE
MGCGGSVPVYSLLENQPLEQSYPSNNNGNLEDKSKVEDILRGDLSTECPSTAKIVRIFTSSTFTDTLYERNSLIERVYPRLKEFCQSRGYEFQVVDMRWGVRDEATDDHMTSELCLREVDLCKKLSTGPSFVTFLSHKYGYRYFPRQIDASELEIIKDNMKSEESKQLLNRWFKKDENSVPPIYILQPISSHIPSFLSHNADDKKKARTQWYEESEKLQESIISTAEICLDENQVERYLMSVTEVEIRRGILNSKQDGERSFWFHRVIEDIDDQPSSYLLSRYKECVGNENHVVQAQEMLQKLREMRLKPALPHDHYKTYNIPWTEKGIDPNGVSSHQQYINKLCEDFESDMKEMIQRAIENKQKSLISSELYQEVVQHAVFCQEKCQAFHGRQNTLSAIRNYLTSDSQEPCIVYGTSGCGKTSVVAMAANNCRVWLGNKCITLLRFIGTTPKSSAIGSLLLTLTNQINMIYGGTSAKSYTNLRDITDDFLKSLGLASKQNPLIIFMDSLDQLDPGGNAKQMFWLPRKLPQNVKVVLSTLPEPQYECYPKLQAMFPVKSNRQFIEVPNLPEKDAKGILSKWFELRKRTLQPHQMTVLLDAFKKCPLPLFLKLSFDEACQWTSYSNRDTTVLETTVRGIVNHLFSRVEALHGKMLVSRALGYLTLSKSGLTEAELEDILSCDDDVLNDVYMYWTPPIRRLPPLILVRMRSELEQYFVVRGADGARVTYWYHRQFVEAARDRYLMDINITKTMNSRLADYFSGIWANGKSKPFTNANKTSSADRHVASQPLMFGETFNYRKINNLAYHRLQADQLQLLKSECLCCFQFISAKLKSQGLRQLLDDYIQARNQYPDDEDIKCVEDALQLSQNALQYNNNELPSQLLGRIEPTKTLNQLLEDCKKSSSYYLEPNQSVLIKPGGSLVHCLAQHTDKPTTVDITSDAQIAVTCSYDKTINVWDVKQGRLLKMFDEVGDKMEMLRLCSDHVVVFKCSVGFIGYNIDTGIEIYRITNGVTFCLCGNNKEYLCIVDNNCISLYTSNNGKLVKQVKCSVATLDNKSQCTGCEKYVASTCDQNKDLVIFDVLTRSFTGIVEGYCEVFVFSPDSTRLYTSHKFKPALYVYNTQDLTSCRTIEGKENIFAQGSLKITKDGRFVYFYYYSDVYIWDVVEESQSVLINHPTQITDIVTIDSRIVVTTAEDRAVRIWDLNRKHNDDGDQDRNGNKGAKVMSTVLFNNPRYVIFKIKRGFYWSWQLYDLFLQKPIKKSTKFGPNFEIFIDDQHVLICGNTKIKLLDLSTMEFKVTYEGQIYSPQGNEIRVIKNSKEFITWSEGQMSIKVYDVQTGKCSKILSANKKHKLESFTVNKDENILVTEGKCEEGVIFYIFDVETYTYKQSVSSDTLGLNTVGIDAKDFIINPQGSKILFKYEEFHKMEIIVCDLFTGTLSQRLLARSVISGTTPVNYQLLTSSTVLIHQEDCFMKVYDFINGSLLMEKNNCNKVSVIDNGPYFLTYGKLKGDNAVKVWDRQKLTSLASFYMDAELRTARCTTDGYHILLTTQEIGDPIIFQLKGGKQIPEYFNYKQLEDYKELYSHSDEDKDIMVLEDQDATKYYFKQES